MDDCAADWLCDHLYRISLFVGRLRAYALFRDELPCTDHRGAAAERQISGSCRGIRRRGEPDGIRAARGGDDTFASNHWVRGHVHGLRVGDGGNSAPRAESVGTRVDTREM